MNRESIGQFLPEWAKSVVWAWRERLLVEEIRSLTIRQIGVSNEAPYIELSDGMRFYGFFPNHWQRLLYRRLQSRIPGVTEDCFGVAAEIVSRYVIPRSLPGETIFNPTRYRPLRDPLNDFDLSESKKREVARRFRPKTGETFVDVGAFLGYGTMRIAQLVGSQGQVVAFEAEPDTLAVLRRNIEENALSNVTIVSKAAADYTSSRGPFYRGGGTASSTQSEVLASLGYEGLAELRVEVDSVDNTLAELGIVDIDLVSITVNGGEPEALAGMQKTLEISEKPRITLAGWYQRQGRRVCDVVEPELQQMGFTVMKGRLGRVLAWK